MGRRNTGKTFLSQQVILKNSLLPKALIIDTLDHPKWRHVPEFPELNHENLTNFKKGVYRIFNEDPEEVIYMLSKYACNTAIICEDATKYLKAKLQPDAKTLMVDSKQRNNDIFFMFHDWGFCPKDIWRFVDLLTIKKTNTGPEERKSVLPMYKLVYKAWEQVMNDPNPYADITLQIGG